MPQIAHLLFVPIVGVRAMKGKKQNFFSTSLFGVSGLLTLPHVNPYVAFVVLDGFSPPNLLNPRLPIRRTNQQTKPLARKKPDPAGKKNGSAVRQGFLDLGLGAPDTLPA